MWMNVPVTLAAIVAPVLMNCLVSHVFVQMEHMGTGVSVS